ncbi:MAG: HK97 gp10 family phage protein [Planctomycetota bacterium]|nr:HK97 gp10 family phage protein [Planctomycetota bacterium]
MEAGLDRKSEQLLEKLAQSLSKEGGDTLQTAVKQIGLEAVEQMVHNLSGVDVSWTDGSFRVNVRTGNLRRHCRADWPYRGDPYSVYVYNNAEYAKQIEEGISGEDKKRQILRGGKHPKVSKAGREYKRIPGGSGSLIPFWTLTEDSHLANQEPRPFVEATASQMKDRAVDLLGRAFMELVKP